MTTCLTFSFLFSNFSKILQLLRSETVLLKTVSKPTPKSLFNSFFQFPFTFLQFFPPNHSNLKLQLSHHSLPLPFSQKYSTPFNLFKLSQTSNPFLRMIKKIAFPIKKKKREKKSQLLSSIKSLLKIFTEITSPSRRVHGVVWSQDARSIFFNARGRTRASAWSRTKRV